MLRVWQKWNSLPALSSGHRKPPKLYTIVIQSETDTISDAIGFRSIEAKGSKILLNRKPVYLKGINIHEENPLKAARAYSESDALLLLNWAKELGCNIVRLAHYPHNEKHDKACWKNGNYGLGWDPCFISKLSFQLRGLQIKWIWWCVNGKQG